MKRRYRIITVILLVCLSVLPSALRAQGYQIADRLPYHASSVYYVSLQNAAGESLNSQYATVDGAIGAFVGGELRGVSQWLSIGNSAAKGVYVVRVWGGKDDEATTAFRLRDSRGLEYQIGTQAFAKDQEGTYGSPSAPILLTVNPVTGISLPFTELTLKVGETRSVKPALMPETPSKLLTTLNYEYSSDAVAFKVSDDGVISALAVGQGKVTVKATPGNFTAQATVKVEQASPYVAVTEIKNNMTSDNIEMQEGDRLQLDYAVLPENATNKAVTFKNNYDIVDIQQDTETSPATIIAKKAGKDTLVVISADNKKATLTYYITVSKKPVHVTKIEVSPATIDAYVGDTYSFTLKVLPENADNKDVEASIENAAVVGIDMEKKQITAKAVGTSKVVFRSKDVPDIEATITVKVSAVPELTLQFASQELTASKLHDVTLTLTKQGNVVFLPSRVELLFSKAANGEPVATATMADETGLKWSVRGQYAGKHTLKLKYNGKELTGTCQLNIPAEYPINKGWDWISLYAASKATNNSIMLKEGDKWVAPMQIDKDNKVIEIRSQSGILYNDTELGFFGDIELLSPTEGMYKVYSTFADDKAPLMVFNAGYQQLVSASDMTLPKTHKGYTWITYPHESDHSFKVLDKYLTNTAERGDMIIGKEYFAEFNGIYWEYPEVFKLEAGKGYIYYTEGNGGKSIDFGSNLPSDPATSRSGNEEAAAIPCTCNTSRFPESMPIVATVVGMNDNGRYIVGAFMDNECRGIGYPVAPNRIHISVAGNMGEMITFQLYDTWTCQWQILPQTIAFSQKTGSWHDPYEIVASSTGIDDIRPSYTTMRSVFDLQGRRIDVAKGREHKKGIYVVVSPNGKITKRVNK